MNIVENILDNLFIWIQKGAVLLLGIIIDEFNLSLYHPGIEYFDETILRGNMDHIMQIFLVASIVLMILLVVFNFFMNQFGTVIEAKDTVSVMLIRIVITILLISIAPPFFQKGLEVGNKMWVYVLEEVGEGTGNNRFGNLENYAWKPSEFFEGIFYEPDDDKSPSDVMQEDKLIGETLSDTIGEVLMESVKVVLIPITILLRCIFLLIVIYQFIKIMVELIKHYVCMGFLFMASPMGFAFFASASTVNITFSYIRMFFCEIFCLIFTRMTISLSLLLLYSLPLNFTNLFVIIAFVTFGSKIGDLLKALGLTVSNTGPALLDTAAITGGVMLRMFSGASNMAGSAMQNIGAATNNMDMVSKGMAMQNVLGGGRNMMDSAGVARTAQSSLGGAFAARKAQAQNASGGKSNLTPSLYDNIKNNLNNGDFQSLGAAAKSMNSLLNEEGRKDLFSRLSEENFGNLKDTLNENGEGISMDINSFDPKNGFGVEFKDEKGNLLRSGTISSFAGKNAIGFEDANGKHQYLNLNGEAPGLAPGETMAMPKNADGNGLSAAELKTGALASAFAAEKEDLSNLEFKGTSDGGFDIRSTDNGNILAHQFKNGNVAHLSTRWENQTISDSTGNTISREDDFIRQFSSGNALGAGEKNQKSVGVFADSGYKDVSNVSFALDGNSVTFDYKDANGNMKSAMFTQAATNYNAVNGKMVDGGKTYGTWIAKPYKRPN